jgi:GT2 family glycosyltransferase
MYGEDLDLCLRVTQAGWQVYYLPAVEVLHHKGGSSGKARALRVNWEFHRAMWTFYRKHQAQRYGSLLTVLVGMAIWTKFLFSAFRSALVRGRRRVGRR